MLLDPPDKLFDRYRILEGEEPANSALVALGFAEKRGVHGALGADMFGIPGATREPVIDATVDAIERRVWRVHRHACCCEFQ